MLGVITGLGFIALPGILAVPSQSSPSTRTTGTNSSSGTTTAFNPNATVQLANSTKTQTPTETTITTGALPFVVSLIIVPAITRSLLNSPIVSWRARKDREKASADDSSPS